MNELTQKYIQGSWYPRCSATKSATRNPSGKPPKPLKLTQREIEDNIAWSNYMAIKRSCLAKLPNV